MGKDDFLQQLAFIIEIDKIKQIVRKTRLFDKSRFENDAEHSWHLAMMAIVLSQYANDDVDLLKVIKMVLIHDLVEIDAGDIIIYDTDNRIEAQKKEADAAKRIFGLLPDEQRDELIALWEEFEARQTPESRFAAAIDRFEPILQNRLNDYEAWKHYGISKSTLYEKNKHIQEGSKKIWEYVESIFSNAIDAGAVTPK